jgi:hypothetical protein
MAMNIIYQMGGMPQQQQQVDPREILGMFLQTLPEEEQEQFIAEFQQMQPEEQMQVVQAIYQKLQQEMQQPQMQQQMMSAQQGDIQMYKEGGTPRNGQTKRSTQKGKKMAVYMDGKWHHFGDSSMQDYRTHKSEKRRQAFYSRHKKNLQGDDPRSKAFRVYARKTWQEGGQTPNVMIEVEGGESVMLPNGELQRFEGPKHSDGGIPVAMPEGAKIYSEHLKAPKEVIELVLGNKTKKKYSYADLSKKFPTKPFEQKLQNPELDKYERQAALVKLENNRTMLETIFQAQETEKEMKNKKVQMSQNYSGMPMAQTGRVVERLYPWFPDTAPYGDTGPNQFSPLIVPAFPISAQEVDMKGTGQWMGSRFTTESLTPQQWAEMPAGQMKGAAPKQPANKPNATQGPVAPRVSPSSTTPSVSRAPQGSGTSPMYSPEMQAYITEITPTGIQIGVPNPILTQIPNVQSNRGNRIYGTQDWSEEQRMNDFKKRHRRFFEQEGNQNWDPKKQGDTRRFQEWYEAEAKRRGTPSYFTGKQNFNKVDDKFGQYTWSAPSFDREGNPIEPLAPLAPSLEDAPAELGTQRAPLEPTYNPEEVIEAVEPGKESLSQGPFIPAPLPPAKKKFGISRQLSGSIFDSLMAASNRLNVDEPQYRDNRKYPMFTRFVDFEDKEVGKNYNLAMQQIMNSNMPEQAKQAQIANLNAKLQDYQGKQDLQRNQLYQQKLNQDTDKLQAYMDRNVDQATADLENYRMKKARVEDLKNQFRAKRKADIVNPIRQYLDFVQEVDLQNQIYSDNFRMNPFTGKVDFYQSTPDALAKTESQMAQYRNNTQFSPTPLGGQFGTLGGVPVYLDPQGRLTIIENQNSSSGGSSRDKEARQAAIALQNYGTTRTTQGG